MDERDYKAMKSRKRKQILADVRNWAYLTSILMGFAIGITLSIVLNLIENIIVKIALIIYGG